MTTSLTIGTDPELVIVNKNNEIVKADEYVQFKSRFGLDQAGRAAGAQFVCELRPKAASSPRTLTRNIKEVLQDGMAKLSKFKWWAGAWQFEKPLGGHIHFGCSPTTEIIDALDHQLAPLLALVEPEEQARARRTIRVYGDHPYGQLSDYREKPWGFEWRTPGSFISTPGTTMGVMAIAKAIVLEELEKAGCAFSKLTPTQRKSIQFKKEDFYNANRKVFEEKIDYLWEIFRGMRYFAEKMEGSSLWSVVSYLKSKVCITGFVPTRDLKKAWKLEPHKGEAETNSPFDAGVIIDRNMRTPFAGPTSFWATGQMLTETAAARIPMEMRLPTIREIWVNL